MNDIADQYLAATGKKRIMLSDSDWISIEKEYSRYKLMKKQGSSDFEFLLVENL